MGWCAGLHAFIPCSAVATIRWTLARTSLLPRCRPRRDDLAARSEAGGEATPSAAADAVLPERGVVDCVDDDSRSPSLPGLLLGRIRLCSGCSGRCGTGCGGRCRSGWGGRRGGGCSRCWCPGRWRCGGCSRCGLGLFGGGAAHPFRLPGDERLTLIAQFPPCALPGSSEGSTRTGEQRHRTSRRLPCTRRRRPSGAR